MNELSIVIGVASDRRIERCVLSIDFPAEIVVVMNGSPVEIQRIVASLPVKTLHLDEPNIGRAYDEGVRMASGEYVLLMDADCVFRPGAIAHMFAALQEAEVCRGTVEFQSDDWQSSVTARARVWHTTKEINAFKPPLGLRKSVLAKLGGYCFDHHIRWREDYELTCRIRAAGLPIRYVPEAVVVHPPLSFSDDLGAGFRYGRGHGNGIRRGLLPGTKRWGGHTSVLASLRLDATRLATAPHWGRRVVREDGWAPAAYLSVWMSAFAAGYYFETGRFASERMFPRRTKGGGRAQA